MEFRLLISLFLFYGYHGDAANILFILPFSSTSHYIALAPIGLELARRGHNVTIITTNKETTPPPNYHQVLAEDKKIWELTGGSRPNVFKMVDISIEEFYHQILWNGGLLYTQIVLESPKVQEFLKQENCFDLVISEQFFHESMYMLAHKYDAPLVLVTTFGNCMKHNIVTRNPLQLHKVLFEFLPLENPSSFWSRLRNLQFTLYEYLMWRFWYLKKQQELVDKYIPDLPEPVPSLYELQQNASLILLNSHFSFDPPTAYLPNVVEIGGFHLFDSQQKLPNDIQSLLDDAEDGVIYVNFGSNLQSSELPMKKRDAFIKVFSEVKQTVLWKWEEDNFANESKTLVVQKWFPQKEILAHPNVKLFISHGGLIGTQEAIFYGVPIIGIPIYADQYNNLLQTEQHGFGKILQYHDINEDTLSNHIEEILNNNSYNINAKKMSALFRDRPMNALDTAMFWIEYVIRHKGAPHIKNPDIQMGWLQFTMLDVYLFILTFVIAILCSLYYVLRFFTNSSGHQYVNIKKHD